MLSSEEWLVCFFSAMPNIFTEELLIWCLSNKLSIEIIKKSITKLLRLGFIDKQYNSEGICFFTMHERFRHIINNKRELCYVYFCKKLIDYYNYYIAPGKEFSKQYYTDKLFYQLTLNDNTEWRQCYQYIFEKGDSFESEKLLNIYQKVIQNSNELLLGWYQYYKIQSEIIKNKNCVPQEPDLNYCLKNNKEFYTYWLNIRGILCLKNGNYKKAEDTFTKALKYTTQNYESYIIQYNICCVYFYTQQYKDAFKSLSKLCDCIDADDLFFYIECKLLLAVINMRMYELQTALMGFQEVLTLKRIYQTQLCAPRPLYLSKKSPRPLCASIDKNIYNYLGEIYSIQGEYLQAIQYHLKGLQYNKIYGNNLGLAWANNDLGKAYYIYGDIQTAQKYLEESVRLFESSTDKLSKAFPLMEMSYVFQYMGDVERTIALLKESFFLLREKGSENEMFVALNNLGRLYQSQGFLNAAEIIFDFCLSGLAKKTSAKHCIGWVHNNIARNYLYLNEYNSAIKHFNIALKIFKEVHEKRGYIYILNNIGETYAKQGKYDDALNLLIDSCRQKEKIEDKHAICYSYREIGELYLKLGQTEKAYSYIDKAFELCRIGNFGMLKGDILTSLGNYYAAIHSLKDALDTYSKALQNYEEQHFYSRSLVCTKKINNLIQEYHYADKKCLDESSIYAKLESKQSLLIMELQELLNNIFK